MKPNNAKSSEKNKRKKIFNIVVIIGFFVLILVSLIFNFKPGISIGHNFGIFSISMIKFLAAAFILIGLFEVWITRKTVEKHLGTASGVTAYLWMILLASTTVGGLYIAFPMAYALWKKGAKLSVMFTYIGAAAGCRIPMMFYEISYMEIKFTLTRLIVSITCIILSSILLGNYLEKRNYKMLSGK